jgi:uncharacterized protein (DUF4415 family)
LKPSEELRKVTLNLYDADVIEMERRFGHGWSADLRELLHNYLARKLEHERRFGRTDQPG